MNDQTTVADVGTAALAGALAGAASFIAPPSAPAANTTAPNSVNATGAPIPGPTLLLIALAVIAVIAIRR